METSDHFQVKHFLLACSHVNDSTIIDKTIDSVGYSMTFKSENGGTVLVSEPRSSKTSISNTFKPLVCGDNQDFNPTESMFLGNGIHIKKKANGSYLLASSLSGLPALFIYKDSKFSIISDNIDSIAKLPFTSLHYDFQAVHELAMIGFPIKHRTLFKEITIIPAGSLVSVSDNKIDIKEASWQPSYEDHFDNNSQYVDKMSDLMQSAIKRMNIEHSFLSLTAGLDTRAILASLAINNKIIPAFTISGSRLTLDAMRGKQLCEYYHTPYQIVSIDNALPENLPEYAMRASRYSGGLSSIEQATEIYFYEMAGTNFEGRLSGNLGNQVGRSGSEGIGMRDASIDVLHSDLKNHKNSNDERHWFFQANTTADLLDPGFLIKRENLFAQINNYSIGHEMLTQQTPYADRELINTKFSEPQSNRDHPQTMSAIKFRDLKHRIIGQSLDHSFQCKVVQMAGGKVATCPINWGWTTDGGFSAGGLYYGSKAFADIAIGNKLDRIPGMKQLLNASGIKGFSSFHTQHTLYTKSMQHFIKEMLLKQSVRESGLFNNARLDELISNGLSDISNYSEVVLTLDLALATENFGARV